MLTLMLISWHLSHALCLSAILMRRQGETRGDSFPLDRGDATGRWSSVGSDWVHCVLVLVARLQHGLPFDESQLLLTRMSKEKKSNMRKERRRRWEGRV